MYGADSISTLSIYLSLLSGVLGSLIYIIYLFVLALVLLSVVVVANVLFNVNHCFSMRAVYLIVL